MKVSEILSQAGKPLISCEFFPPKTEEGMIRLWRALEELRAVGPAFVSVTYGAGGSTRERTLGIVVRIKQETEMIPVAHLTCVGADKDELRQLLSRYHQAGIENILALRGDPPEGMARFEAVANGFAHASDLIAYLRRLDDFSIGCATYPEGHPESAGGVDDDVRYLKLKQDNGADYAITQYFFDNSAYFTFLDKCRSAGVTIPIIPGIMPITNYDQIVRFSARCGARIPEWLDERMAPIREDLNAVRALGVELAVAQCRELIEQGAPGLHFYTLNKSQATIAIVEQLRDLL